MKQGKLKEAIECYDETIKLDPAAIPLVIENIITMIRLFESYAFSHLFPMIRLFESYASSHLFPLIIAAIPLVIENIITMIRLFESYASSHLFPISSCWVARRYRKKLTQNRLRDNHYPNLLSKNVHCTKT
jgi:hypothetical protein